MIYPIVKYGQPVLEKRGEDITEFDTPELHQLVEDMFESMYAAKGVGLAAPQIGVGKRLAVIDITTGEDPAQKIVLINPEIVKTEGSQKSEEGCLSLPTFREQVVRPLKVTVAPRTPRAKNSRWRATIFWRAPFCMRPTILTGNCTSATSAR